MAPAAVEQPAPTFRRFTGRMGVDLYRTLREAGVSEANARTYYKALSTRIDASRELVPDDRYDLIVDSAPEEGSDGKLLYAGADRIGASDLQLIRWKEGGREQWLDLEGLARTSNGMITPVAAAISSRFGIRMHPILGYSRFHRGVDFKARWGAPVVAAADGRVTSAGWHGGYGQQVRIAHPGGIQTSYAHLSRIAAGSGAYVRQGQVIGYVGSTGLSTGPHLHYEVARNGRAVDPATANLGQPMTMEREELRAMRSSARELLILGTSSSAKM